MPGTSSMSMSLCQKLSGERKRKQLKTRCNMEQEKLTGRWFVETIQLYGSAPQMTKKLAEVMRQMVRTVLSAEEVNEFFDHLRYIQEGYWRDNKRLKKVDLYMDHYGIQDEVAVIHAGVHCWLRLVQVKEYHW